MFPKSRKDRETTFTNSEIISSTPTKLRMIMLKTATRKIKRDFAEILNLILPEIIASIGERRGTNLTRYSEIPSVLILKICVAVRETRARASVVLRSLVAPRNKGIISSCSFIPNVLIPGMRFVKLAISIKRKKVIKKGKITSVLLPAIDVVKP